MNDIDVNRVLAQIRSLQSQAAARPAPATTAVAPQGGFEGLLKSAIEQVSAKQGEATRLQEAFAAGDRETDLSSVMLASAKAQVAFKGMVEVRNRLVNAYQEIMNMPV